MIQHPYKYMSVICTWYLNKYKQTSYQQHPLPKSEKKNTSLKSAYFQPGKNGLKYKFCERFALLVQPPISIIHIIYNTHVIRFTIYLSLSLYIYIYIYIIYNTLSKTGAFQLFSPFSPPSNWPTQLPPALQLHEVPSSATCQVRNAHLKKSVCHRWQPGATRWALVTSP